MAYVDKINVQGTDYDINDKRLPEINGVVTLNDEFTANEIVEKMSGYSFTPRTGDLGWNSIYVGCVKNGNKLTIVVFGTTTNDLDSAVPVLADIGYFTIPSSVGSKLYPYTLGLETDILDTKVIKVVDASKQPYTEAGEDFILNIRKISDTRIECRISGSLKPGTHYFRIEETFLLSENLVA